MCIECGSYLGVPPEGCNMYPFRLNRNDNAVKPELHMNTDGSVSCIQGSAELLARTLKGKNEDYRVDGEFSNFERAAEFTGVSPLQVMLAQIAIKYTRIQGLRNFETPNNESLKDSLLDLAGYAIIAHAYLETDS